MECFKVQHDHIVARVAHAYDGLLHAKSSENGEVVYAVSRNSYQVSMVYGKQRMLDNGDIVVWSMLSNGKHKLILIKNDAWLSKTDVLCSMLNIVNNNDVVLSNIINALDICPNDALKKIIDFLWDRNNSLTSTEVWKALLDD